ncbi:MAG TPA: hypothetical protein DC058_04415, partial [Planctomycetaceae bacterium]|nr:hypothetical protein [Planctomycetaceae bacterium]
MKCDSGPWPGLPWREVMPDAGDFASQQPEWPAVLSRGSAAIVPAGMIAGSSFLQRSRRNCRRG